MGSNRRQVETIYGVKLTDDDIQTLTGKKDHLVGKIQERYGIARAEAEKQAEAWSHALKETRSESAATRL